LPYQFILGRQDDYEPEDMEENSYSFFQSNIPVFALRE
jgi:hypothetical protein